MDFIKAIIKPTYWITHQHPVPEAWQLGLKVFFGVLLVIALVATVLAFVKKFKKPMRNVFARVSAWGWVMGILGYLLLFFSIEQVAYMSARMFYLFWLVILIWWAYYIVRYAVKDVPRLIQGQKDYIDSQKYLPKKKKK